MESQTKVTHQNSLEHSMDTNESQRSRQMSQGSVDSEAKLAKALASKSNGSLASEVLRSVLMIGRDGPVQVVRKYKVHSSVSAFILLVGLCSALVFFALHERDFDNSLRRTVRSASVPYAESLRVNLENSVGGAFALSSILGADERLNNATWENFDTVAAGLLRTTPGITNLQLAPCAVVSKIFPLEGNEAAIGHNLIQDQDRAKGALETIESRKLTFVGPLTLLQGGKAIIGRVPVYLNQTGSGDPRCLWNFYGLTPPGNFWGFATMLAKLDDLLAPVHLEELYTNLDIEYQLVAPWGGQDVLVASSPGDATTLSIADFASVGSSGTWLAAIFFGSYSDQVLEDLPVQFGRDTDLNFATWTLRVRPTGGWAGYSPRLPLMIFSLLISVINGLIGSYISISGRLQLESWKVAILRVITTVEAVEAVEAQKAVAVEIPEGIVKDAAVEEKEAAVVEETTVDDPMQPSVDDLEEYTL